MNRFVRCISGALLGLAACATTQLTEGGKNLRVLDQRAALGGCKELGEVSSSGMNVASLNNDVRNQAAAKGANTLVEYDAVPGRNIQMVKGMAYVCEMGEAPGATSTAAPN